MTYIVTRPAAQTKKLTLEEILFDMVDDEKIEKMNYNGPRVNTRTYHVSDDAITNMITDKIGIEKDIEIMEEFYNRHKNLDVFFDNRYNYERQLSVLSEIQKEFILSNTEIDDDVMITKAKEILTKEGIEFNPLYHTFWVPKKSGSGMRRIDAPEDELKELLRELKFWLEKFMRQNTYHTSAYAYIPNRSTKDLVEKLQRNHSRWILKLDFSNFFGSIDLEFTMRQLKKIFPFSEYTKTERGEKALYNCLKFCFLDGRLPQGTPISPLLTNILMIPIDYKISNALYKKATEITTFDKEDGVNRSLIYTRYADDIFIGGHMGFKYQSVLDYIRKIIAEEEAPFVIKPSKTRYGSIAGKNWILGLMYNQDGNITIGNKRKKQIEAMIHNFAKDYTNGMMWEAGDIQVAMGNMSYLASIEKDYYDKLLNKYNQKFNFDITDTMKKCIYAT